MGFPLWFPALFCSCKEEHALSRSFAFPCLRDYPKREALQTEHSRPHFTNNGWLNSQQNEILDSDKGLMQSWLWSQRLNRCRQAPQNDQGRLQGRRL